MVFIDYVQTNIQLAKEMGIFLPKYNILRNLDSPSILFGLFLFSKFSVLWCFRRKGPIAFALRPANAFRTNS